MATQHSDEQNKHHERNRDHGDSERRYSRSNGDRIADNVNYFRNYSLKLGEYTIDMFTAGLDGMRTTLNACGTDGTNDCVSGYGFVDAVVRGQKRFFDEMSQNSNTLLQRLNTERDVYNKRRGEPLEKIDYDKLATLVAEKLENMRKTPK